MDYRGGLKAMYNNPNWLVQTSLIGLCFLIPVVGPIAVMGYSFEAGAYLHKTNREGYPDFNFGRFGPYLARGVGPFLIGLAFGLVVALPVYLLEEMIRFFAIQLIVPLVADQNSPGTALGTTATLSLIFNAIFFVLNTMLNIIPLSLMIRGGLSGEIGESFRFSFAGDFFKRSGNDAFMAQLYLSFLAACCFWFAIVPFWTLWVFALPAIGVYMLSFGWISCQLYRSYLTEKGAPFRVKCEIIEE